MILLTGFAYPLLITFIARMSMPEQANGSLIFENDKLIGSKLIAQKFTEDKYFWPRPSAIDYKPIPSGGSNLGPTSSKLKEIVAERKKLVGESAPVEMLYASGSGLDPHISMQNAYYQMDRVAKARGIDKAQLQEKIDSFVEGKFLGPKYVNVLLLNQELDANVVR